MPTHDALDSDKLGRLSDATLAALNLQKQPFGTPAADAAEWFVDDTIEDQLTDTKEALITGDDLLLVIGERGAGKSALLQQLGANSGLRLQCFSVKGSPRFSTNNLFAGMLEAFKRRPPDDLKLALDDLIPCLQGMINRNTLSAIVIDDADQVPEPELTKLLSGMLYINSREETLIRVTLAAGSDIDERIPELLPEGADMPYSTLSIEPFSLEQSRSLLEFRLAQAGFDGEFPFDDEQTTTMSVRAEGLPGKLLALAADVLNERHGMLEPELPPELQDTAIVSAGASSGKSMKLALGVLACALILGGLLLFQSEPRPEREDVASLEERSVNSPEDAERLRLLKEEQSARAITEAQRKAIEVAEKEAEEARKAEAAKAQAAADEAARQLTAERAAELAAEQVAAATRTLAAEQAVADAEAATDADPTAPAASETDAANASVDTEADSGTASPATETDTNIDSAVSETASEAAESDGEGTPAATPETDTGETQAAAQESATETAPQSAADNGQNGEAAEDSTLGNLESPNWILVQNPGQFTVQLSASRDRQSVLQFLQRNDLEAPNSIYSFKRNNVTWFALVHGIYPSINDARAAIERLPERARSNQPWIRAISRIQTAVKESN